MFLKVVSRWSFERTIESIRTVPLQGDSSVYPYREATFTLREIEINELAPLSRYVLEKNLLYHETTYKSLLDNGVNIFRLDSIVEYVYQKTVTRICAPIVEACEDSNQKDVLALVDGLHRCVYARSNGIQKISCIVIDNIPKAYPLMALPLSWKDVRTVYQVPSDAEKRILRYPRLEEFPDISQFSRRRPKNDKESRYFFYRDLSILGSQGIR